MTNVIAYASEWAEEARNSGKTYEEARHAVQERATANHPLYLGIVSQVTYQDKTDRYVAKIGNGSTVRVSNDVAQFLLQHALEGWGNGPCPTVNAHMTDGVVDSVLLLFLYRSDV